MTNHNGCEHGRGISGYLLLLPKGAILRRSVQHSSAETVPTEQPREFPDEFIVAIQHCTENEQDNNKDDASDHSASNNRSRELLHAQCVLRRLPASVKTMLPRHGCSPAIAIVDNFSRTSNSHHGAFAQQSANAVVGNIRNDDGPERSSIATPRGLLSCVAVAASLSPLNPAEPAPAIVTCPPLRVGADNMVAGVRKDQQHGSAAGARRGQQMSLARRHRCTLRRHLQQSWQS